MSDISQANAGGQEIAHQRLPSSSSQVWEKILALAPPGNEQYLLWQRSQWLKKDKLLAYWGKGDGLILKLASDEANPATTSVTGVGQPPAVASLAEQIISELDSHHLTMPEGTWEYWKPELAGFSEVSRWDLLYADHINANATPPHFGGEIVEFPESEFDEVRQFHEEVFPDTHLRVGQPDTRWFGLRYQGQIDCVIGASGWKTNDCVHLGGFSTRPSARGRGIGTAVMAHVSQLAIAATGGVSLGVFRSNVAAIALYHRIGFTTLYRADSRHFAN